MGELSLCEEFLKWDPYELKIVECEHPTLGSFLEAGAAEPPTPRCRRRKLMLAAAQSLCRFEDKMLCIIKVSLEITFRFV